MSDGLRIVEERHYGKRKAADNKRYVEKYFYALRMVELIMFSKEMEIKQIDLLAPHDALVAPYDQITLLQSQSGPTHAGDNRGGVGLEMETCKMKTIEAFTVRWRGGGEDWAWGIKGGGSPSFRFAIRSDALDFTPRHYIKISKCINRV